VCSYEDFMDSSKELEQEYEFTIANKIERIESLNSRIQKLELREMESTAQHAITANTLNMLQAENQALKNKLAATVAIKCTLELQLDACEGKVRVLEATDGSQANRIHQLEEELVFAQSDVESLRDTAKELMFDKQQLELDNVVQKNELSKMKHELALLQPQANDAAALSPLHADNVATKAVECGVNAHSNVESPPVPKVPRCCTIQ
jgi:chromosome segregation ATPase